MRSKIGTFAAIVSLGAVAALAMPATALGDSTDAEAGGVPIVEIAPSGPAPESSLRATQAFAGTAPTPESVIGADGRTQYLTTTAYPQRAIGQINLVQNGSSFICTGWLIDKNTVLSSGHCAYGPSTPNDPIESATFAPGRNGATNPYGVCNVATIFAPVGWSANLQFAHDWSLMQLDCNVGTTTGWLGIMYKTNGSALKGLTSRLVGYPGDKPSGTMWGMTKTIEAVSTQMLYYTMDTFGGQSGSPVFRPTAPACGGPCGMAIHSYGVGLPGAGLTRNAGPRITEARFNKIVDLANNNG